MKTFKRVLAWIVTAITTLSIASCSLYDEEFQKTKDSVGKLTPVVINGFETPTDFYGVHSDMFSGVVVEKANVYTGKQSLKFWKKKGGDSQNGFTSLIQELDIRDKGNYTNLSLIKMMSYRIYNAQDEAMEISCMLTFKGDMKLKYNATLAPKEWTFVRHDIRREMLPDLTCTMITINVPTPNIDQEYVYYFDDLTFYQSTQGADRNVIERAEHEVYSFDWSNQISGCYFWHGGLAENSAEIEKSLFTKDGYGSSMYVKTTLNETMNEVWPLIELDLATVYSFPWAYYDDNDVLALDYYIPEETGIDGLWLNLYTTQGIRFFHPQMEGLVRGEWATYRISVKDIRLEQSKESTFDRLGKISFGWYGKRGQKQTFDFYIDNIRMELNPNG